MKQGDIDAASGVGCPDPSRGMEIRISIRTTQPLTGAAMTENERPLPFAGWLDLLEAVSRLIWRLGVPLEKPKQGDET